VSACRPAAASRPIAADAAYLIEFGCKHGQGFLLGKPAPPDDLEAMLRTVNTTEVAITARLARLQQAHGESGAGRGWPTPP
jgi:hypothetical protein